MMRSLSPSDLQGEQRQRWAQARRELYRGILRDPHASEVQKARARKKLEATQEK